jgi:hypothetical protein
MIRKKVIRSATEAIKATVYGRRPSIESIDSVVTKDGVICLRRTTFFLQKFIGALLRRHIEALDSLVKVASSSNLFVGKGKIAMSNLLIQAFHYLWNQFVA